MSKYTESERDRTQAGEADPVLTPNIATIDTHAAPAVNRDRGRDQNE